MSKIENQEVGNLISCAIQLQSLNIYIHYVAALQNQDLKKSFQVQILFHKLKDTSSSSMARKVIFRFEGANPRDKVTYSKVTRQGSCLSACGLFSVSILFWAKELNVKRKKKEKIVLSLQRRYMKTKKNLY